MTEAKSAYKGIMIAIPCYGGSIEQETHASVTTLIRFLAKNNIPNSEYMLSMAPVSQARNAILTRFYDDTDYEHLLMIDDDMQFMPTMIARALNLQKPVVGAVYNKRELPNQGQAWSSIVGTPLPDIDDQPIVDGFQKWKYVGGGVLLISRDCVTEMLKKLPISDNMDSNAHNRLGVTRMIRAFDEIKQESNVRLSEDNSFCERWRQCGGEIWAAVDYPVGHVGKFNFCINPAEYLKLKKPEEKPDAVIAA